MKFSRPQPFQYPVLEKIYTEAFPPEERRPWRDVIAGGQTPALRAIEADGMTIGLITYWNFTKFIYIEHFAIDYEHRCGGMGSRALKAFIDKQSKPVLLEVEHPSDTDPMTQRRINFYTRHGFCVLPYTYIQPPYEPGMPAVPLLLMATAPIPDPTQILHSQVYKADASVR